MIKYDLETLKKENFSYDREHGVTQSDVDKANMYVALIESSRNAKLPASGDIVQLTDRHGNYYGNAHIERVDSKVYVCEQPYVPFIKPDKTGIFCNTSGGAWLNIPVQLKLIGKRSKRFCDWGHCGACGNGAIHFNAEVNVWEYIEPEPLYEGYTTKQWRKLYVAHAGKHENYEYTSDGIAWKNRHELDEFIKKYKGVVFFCEKQNHFVVWCYREKKVIVEPEELERMNLPETTILLNGKRRAKMQVENENKLIIHYANW
jgi:hypothetical protein